VDQVRGGLDVFKVNRTAGEWIGASREAQLAGARGQP
jgi:hypothetical protein